MKKKTYYQNQIFLKNLVSFVDNFLEQTTKAFATIAEVFLFCYYVCFQCKSLHRNPFLMQLWPICEEFMVSNLCLNISSSGDYGLIKLTCKFFLDLYTMIIILKTCILTINGWIGQQTIFCQTSPICSESSPLGTSTLSSLLHDPIEDSSTLSYV